MSAFDRLHPGIQHHVVNTFGWKQLRPLQEQAIGPILDGEHAILIAPTAGGKTEAAFFPLLSRMLYENWSGLSLLYLCPIKALLNNLEPRLQRYADLVGRRVAVWHGDVPEGAKRRIDADPPDVLLTTPESLEVMLVSKRRDHERIFAGLYAVIVDEIHAFAGDDRGWHLLSVLERVTRVAGRDVQRVGLSATVGNPDDLLTWLEGSCEGAGRCLVPPAADEASPEVGLDYVGGLENAARVIATLHRGEKRLVFVDSRAGVELVSAHLRQLGVKTFVSHSSLGVDERRQAEQAFAEGSDCVIVATSTLELGIDVGDLDRVIQVDAPTTVAAFLQRLGRTGRRPGTSRNCLFLATDEDAFLEAAGLIQLWSEGFVEPIQPPPLPYHVLAQQLLALTLQEGGLGRTRWPEWVGGMPGFAAMPPARVETLVAHMLENAILFEDEGVLSIGLQGEKAFGGKNYLDLFSVFSSPPLFRVLFGRKELGFVHESSFQAKQTGVPVLLLAGRGWAVTHVDWTRRVAHVEPTPEIGKSRWLGSGQALHFALCRAIRRVLAKKACPGKLSRRALETLDRLAQDFWWVDEDSTAVVRDATGRVRWWTFAGLTTNLVLAEHLASFGREASIPRNLFVPLDESTGIDAFVEAVQGLKFDHADLVAPTPADDAIEAVKFAECLPFALAVEMLRARMAVGDPVAACLGQPVRGVETG